MTSAESSERAHDEGGSSRAQLGRLPLAISVGDPAGIGPEVSVRGALNAIQRDRVVLFGDMSHLEELASTCGVSSARTLRLPEAGPWSLPLGTLGIAHVTECEAPVAEARRPTPEGGRAQVAWLDAAIESVRRGHCRALVTGPTSKEAIRLAGVDFIGQTEHLARAAGLADDEVTMMFLGPRLRVALVTTHLAVRQVSPAVTAHRVERTIVHLAQAILRLRPEIDPSPLRIAVVGLNPHAGEGGLFGDEERVVIEPAIEAAKGRVGIAEAGVLIEGPRPAEAVFREAASGALTGVVAMMHDQATIASKLLDWGSAVNVTWGLPFVRTSVDHGVAYDAAARGTASEEGMTAAIRMAQRLTASPLR